MNFRTLLPALGLLCLYCSSAQAQTLDDTLLTVTVDFDGLGPTYSITSFGLPQGEYMNVGGLCCVLYTFTSSASFVEAVPTPEVDCIAGGINFLYRGSAGPITALGTYPMSTTSYSQIGSCDGTNIFFGTGDIIVAAASPAPTPEPISGSLMAIGFAMLALRQRLARNHVRPDPRGTEVRLGTGPKSHKVLHLSG